MMMTKMDDNDEDTVKYFLINRQLPAGHVCPLSNNQISFQETIFELSFDPA